MTMARRWRRWFAAGIVVYTIVVGVPQGSAPQDVKAEDNGNTERISLNMGVDWVSEYFFRGIAQQVGG